MRVLDPHSKASLLVGNVYQPQASQSEQQEALLNLISRVIERWSGQSETQSNHVIIGGDWNTSLLQRIGNSNSHTLDELTCGSGRGVSPTD